VIDAAESLGFKFVLNREFAASTNDFSAVVAELKDAQPDVATVVGRVQNDIRLARQLVESGVKAGTVVAVAAGIQGFQDDQKRELNTDAPTALRDAVRLLLHTNVQRNWWTYSLDVSTAFLQADKMIQI